MSNGVIVGRFQGHGMHDGHIDLIQTVKSRHDNVIIVLGCSPLINSFNNPLSFEQRKSFIQKDFPDARIVRLDDSHSDQVWSDNLDRLVDIVCDTSRPTTLYGGRDSFIPYYSGHYATAELSQKHHQSATEVRKAIHAQHIDSEDFRAGIIWASGNRYPTCFPTVDVAIFNPEFDNMLLGKKADEPMYRLIGGFADPDSDTYEDDAEREAMEEANVKLSFPRYIGSYKIDDWRYRSEPDCIKTMLFAATTIDEGKAGDDIEDIQWYSTYDVENHGIDFVMPLHVKMAQAAARFGTASMMMNLTGV